MNYMRSGSVHTSAIHHNLLGVTGVLWLVSSVARKLRGGANLRLSLLTNAVRCCSLSNNYAGGHDKAREQE
jgi:hypothetical protein